MDVLVVCVTIVMLCAIGAVVLLWEHHDDERPLDDWLSALSCPRMVVHTNDERSIEGTVMRVTGDGLLLRAAKLIGKPTVPLGGEVFIPRERVLFVQTVEAPEASA